MPDETFARAAAQAHALGVSRSEFVTRAIQHYLDDLEKGSLTRQIDVALDIVHTDDSSALAVEVAHRHLAAEDDW